MNTLFKLYDAFVSGRFSVINLFNLINSVRQRFPMIVWPDPTKHKASPFRYGYLAFSLIQLVVRDSHMFFALWVIVANMIFIASNNSMEKLTFYGVYHSWTRHSTFLNISSYGSKLLHFLIFLKISNILWDTSDNSSFFAFDMNLHSVLPSSSSNFIACFPLFSV